MATDPRTELLLDLIERAYRERSWHGPNLRNALRGVDAETALWSPGPERPSIQQLVIHAAYWKYRVLRQLDEEAPRSFDEPGSNFFPRPLPGVSPESKIGSWEDDQRRLDEWHERLLAAVGKFPVDRLEDVAYDRYTYRELISGAAAHDVYHAGQIRLIRRLREGRKS